jgi:hypothetical protein
MECEVIRLDIDDLVQEYYGENPRPISWPELQSMRDLALHFLHNGTKNEQRLAHRLAHAAAWISAEAKAIWTA